MSLRRTSTPGTLSLPAPDAPERARSLSERGGPATVLPADVPSGCGRTAPLLHHVVEDGRLMLLLPDYDPVTSACTEPRRELPVMLELTDRAPVTLTERVRGLLWVTGWLRRLDRRAARRTAMEIAAHRPDPRMLDVNNGAAVLRLRPAALILADGEGTEPVSPEDFAVADADPFCRQEAGWLRHLEEHHADVLAQLARHVPARLRGPDTRVRPLGLDRYGLRLRIERAGGDADVRLGFSRPVTDSRGLSQEIRTMLGCPFLRARGSRG